MTQDELIRLLSGIKGRVSSEVMKTIRRILVLATEYSYLGKRFSFSADEDLDSNVNRILVELSDAILDDTDTAIVKTIEDEEDSDAVFAYVYRNDNEARMDAHSSNLKYLLEGYFAVCFANSLTNADILGGALVYLANPNGYGLMRDALRDAEYASPFIVDGGFHFGKGVATNPMDGMTRLSQTMLGEAWHNERIIGFRKDPNIIGYRVMRGSNYDCPICDDLTVGIHPLTEQVLLAHPSCCCYEVPVYANEV